MALAERVVAQALLLVMAASLQLSHAAVYKVGDSGGWTSIGNIDYKQWAATKTFQVGDIIRNQQPYNCFCPESDRIASLRKDKSGGKIQLPREVEYHNVMRVTHPMYRACNATAPLATYTTGNDTITITTKGHHYFLCGVPGHCQAGQKVDINVLRTSETAPTPSPSGLSPPPSFPSVGIPASSPSKATSLKASKGSFSKLGLAMAAFAVFVSGLH
ncbi:Phytocyanin domain - like 10 [Theobroma cacao]|nr:Phytocyanin domain - like 10 [Theobroma cacao]